MCVDAPGVGDGIPKFVLQNLQGGVSRNVQRIEARV